MKHLNSFVCLIFLICMTVGESQATDVRVYSESGYSKSQFIMKIFADIHEDSHGPLVSAGVKLTYPAQKLKNPMALKNEALWYFGSPGSTYSYLLPFSEKPGEIVVLLGKLDIHSPKAGVRDDRILIARVTFDRIANADLPIATDFMLEYGRPFPYTNFATAKGTDLDGTVIFSASTLISTLSDRFFTDSIRSLKVISSIPQQIPVRSSEFHVDGNHKIGLPEAVHNLKKSAESHNLNGN